MASNTDYLPDEITYGFVADRVLLAIGDTNSDYNRYPDGVPAQGTVRFSPERTILYTQQRPATVLPQDIECTIYHRDHPVALENGYEPELVGKLVDPAGHVGNVALIVGWYDVVYRLSTGTAQRFRFQVKPEHTAENPLWLPEVAPLQPTPSERFVVNEQVYNDTKTARDEAVDAAQDAVEARTGAETARDQAEGYRDEAGQSATSAAEILSDVQALGITVDTSVGTRVFVGDTMIHGDTGWRDISGLIHEDLTGTAYIKRENNEVKISASLRTTESVGAVPLRTRRRLLQLPSGFLASGILAYRGVGYGRHNGVLVSVDMAYLFTWLDLADNTVQTNLGNWDSVLSINYSFPVDTNWPTSLPGTPA